MSSITIIEFASIIKLYRLIHDQRTVRINLQVATKMRATEQNNNDNKIKKQILF